MNETSCLRCGGEMLLPGTRKIQLGVGLAIGMFSNVLAGDIAVNIHVCSACKKMEFYYDGHVPEKYESEEMEALPQRVCPACGDVHDFDFPKCPACKHLYE